MSTLPLRAVLAFLALPGIVGFVGPWLIAGRPVSFAAVDPLALVPFSAGLAVLLWCVAAFYRQGRGTLAPWDPPRHLVRAGLYRWSRNPMYVGVTLIIWGWAVALHSQAVWIYAAIVMVAFHLRVVLYEEPWLARTFGEDWLRYKGEVRRWF